MTSPEVNIPASAPAEPNKTPKDRGIFRLGLAFFVLLATVIVLQIVIALVAKLAFPKLTEMFLFNWMLSLVPLYVFGLPLCMLVLKRVPRAPFETKSLSFPKLLLCAVVVFGVMLAGNLIGNALNGIANMITGVESTNPVLDMVSGSGMLMLFVATVIIAPLGEEFIFRRLLIDRVRSYGELPAILLSGLMFGAFHMNFYQFFYAFFVGVVFAYIYVKTGRLRYSIALHATMNLFGGVISAALLKAIEGIPMDNPEAIAGSDMIILVLAILGLLGYLLLLFGSLITTVVLGIVFRRRIRIERGKGVLCFLRSPFFILFFLLCIVFMILSLFA